MAKGQCDDPLHVRRVLEAESVEERLDALEAVLRDWRGPASSTGSIDLAAAESGLGIELPLAYRHFCVEQLSRRREFWRIQDPFLDPEDLTVSDDLLEFMVENQSVVDWRLWLETPRDDPPVVLVRDRGTEVESETFTEFLVGAAIFKLVFATKHFGWCRIGDNHLQAVEARHAPLPLSRWHWPTNETWFCGDGDVLLAVAERTDTWIYMAARTEPAFQGFMRDLPCDEFDWEVRSDEL